MWWCWWWWQYCSFQYHIKDIYFIFRYTSVTVVWCVCYSFTDDAHISMGSKLDRRTHFHFFDGLLCVFALFAKKNICYYWIFSSLTLASLYLSHFSRHSCGELSAAVVMHGFPYIFHLFGELSEWATNNTQYMKWT